MGNVIPAPTKATNHKGKSAAFVAAMAIAICLIPVAPRNAHAYCELAGHAVDANGDCAGGSGSGRSGDDGSTRRAAVGAAVGAAGIILNGLLGAATAEPSEEEIERKVKKEMHDQMYAPLGSKTKAGLKQAENDPTLDPWLSKPHAKNSDVKAMRRSVDCDDLQQYVENYIPLSAEDRPTQLKERWESARGDIPRYMPCKQSYDTYHSFDEKTHQTNMASAASSASSQKSGTGGENKVSKGQGNGDHSGDIDPVTKKPCVQIANATSQSLNYQGKITKTYNYTFTNTCKRHFDITIFEKSGGEGLAQVNGYGKTKWFCTDGHWANKDCGGGISGFSYH